MRKALDEHAYPRWRSHFPGKVSKNAVPARIEATQLLNDPSSELSFARAQNEEDGIQQKETQVADKGKDQTRTAKLKNTTS